MAITPATAWTPQMTKLVGNTGGAVESLPDVTLIGARVRAQQAVIPLASQTAGTVTHIARLPLGAAIIGIVFNTDTSLGSTTVALGNAGDGNSAIYTAAATLTSTDTPTWRLKQAKQQVQITSGTDYLGASAAFEDVTVTMAAATAPSSGNLTITVLYVHD